MRRLGTMSQHGAARRSRNGERRVDVERVGAITVRLHRPRVTARTTPALLWVHGGGYVMGTAAQDDVLCRVVAKQLNVLVAAVDYRLAPEHPFPVPLEDCHDALVWLAARPDVDAERIAIGGASAGGGLAAALALLARDRGVVTPVLQLLSYPMLDDRTTLRTDIDERHLRLWNGASNRFGWSCYLGTTPGQPAVPSGAVPARHDDLSKLPPAWIGVGTLDLLYEEDLAYADRLRAAGVACEVEVVDGAFHGFDSVRPHASVTQRYRAAQLQALAGPLRTNEHVSG
jgi:acetyl esterase/lipase